MPPSIFCPDTTWTGTQILLSEQHCGLAGVFRFWGGFMSQGHEQIATTVVGETAKSAPPVAVVSMSWAGVSLNDWVLIATLVWLSVQIGWFIWSNIIKPRAKQVG